MKSAQQKRREAREVRKAAERMVKEEKSARIKERPEMKEAVRVAVAPPSRKSVRFGADPGSIYFMTMAWTEQHADKQDAWSWGALRQWTDHEWNSVIFPKLTEWEKLRWSEIEAQVGGNERNRHRLHHWMPKDILCGDARKRLEYLQDEQRKRHADLQEKEEPVVVPYGDEEIFRFRLGGKPRLWGYRIVNVFHITWFDAEHRVYPTEVD